MHVEYHLNIPKASRSFRGSKTISGQSRNYAGWIMRNSYLDVKRTFTKSNSRMVGHRNDGRSIKHSMQKFQDICIFASPSRLCTISLCGKGDSVLLHEMSFQFDGEDARSETFIASVVNVNRLPTPPNH